MRLVQRRMVSLVMALVVVSVAFPVAAASPGRRTSTSITLLNAPPTALAVGETYTLEILVQSAKPFSLAAVQPDIEYPAYVHGSGGDRKQNSTSAVLRLTLTGVRPTAGLPGGATPVTAVVGVRYPNGQLLVERFAFDVTVY